jgi:hypothetical protein
MVFCTQKLAGFVWYFAKCKQAMRELNYENLYIKAQLATKSN